MVTRSPFFTPIALRTLANLETSRLSAKYEYVRTSPRSPTHTSESLFLRQVRWCRSRQFWTMFVCPPANHLKKGLFESSRTLSHFRYHSSSCASAAQKPSRSSLALRANASQSLTRAFATTSADG